MKALVTLKVQANSILTEDEIIGIVGQQRYDELKETQPGGIIKSWVLCHEGESNPKVLGKGQRKIVWGKEAIKSAYQKVKNGIKIFLGHNEDNSTEGRKSSGEVIGKTQKIVDGKLSTIMIAHFPPETKEDAERSDTVSMEADWNLIEKGKEWIADSVEAITGIALGNSLEVSPGFAGAREVATIQAFGADVADPPAREELDFKDVKSAVRKYRIFASQIYDPSEVIGRFTLTENGIDWDGGDREFQTYIAKNISRHYDKRISELVDKVEGMEKAVRDAAKEKARLEAKPKLEALLKEKEVSPLIQRLVLKHIDKMEIGDDPDKSLKEFMEREIEEYSDLQDIQEGPKFPDTPQPNLGGDADAEEENIFLPKESK